MTRKNPSNPPAPWHGQLTASQEQLSTVNCFYYDEGKKAVMGPVSMLDVSQMIHTWQIRPDTQVMLAGTDSWRSYFEEENKICPSDEAARKAARMLESRTTNVYYSWLQEVKGPVLLSELYDMVLADKLPINVMVCFDGTEEWIQANQL